MWGNYICPNRVVWFPTTLGHARSQQAVSNPSFEIESLTTYGSIASLLSTHPSSKSLGLSIVTPPKVTLSTLSDILSNPSASGESPELKVGSVWLQPGTFDAAVESKIKSLPEGVRNKFIWGQDPNGGVACILRVDDLWSERAKL